MNTAVTLSQEHHADAEDSGPAMKTKIDSDLSEDAGVVVHADESTGTDTWDDSSLDGNASPPLLKYSKLAGLPRMTSSVGPNSSSGPIVSECTSTTVAQVLLNPAPTTPGDLETDSSNGSVGPNPPGRPTTTSEEQHLLTSDLWKQPHLIMAIGWSTGNVSLLSVANGMAVVISGGDATAMAAQHDISEGMLPVRDGPWNEPPPTVDVSMDSSGTVLAAIDTGGVCCIWDLRYSAGWQRRRQNGSSGPTDSSAPRSNNATTTSSTTAATPSPAIKSNNMLSNFMSALTGMPQNAQGAAQSSISTTEDRSDASASGSAAKIPCLVATISQISRITYPPNWKNPTCMMLDPGHRKKSSKYLAVGFSDGRLILTKRGGLFHRRNDVVLYQGTGGTESSSYRGIECLAWRSNLIAWADAGGIKVLDVDTLTRIAHIDRPTGARAALYPTLTGLAPQLVFETSQTLLVAWGDCLMSMSIQAHPVVGEGTSIGLRRTVECTMAWELAGMVASGVAPLDSNHVLVVGVVVPEEPDEEIVQDSEDLTPAVVISTDTATAGNELEVQIVSRHDGTVQYADVLPAHDIVSAASFQLLSSFVLPRMDDNSEWDEYKTWSGQGNGFDDFDLSLLTGAGMQSSAMSSDPTRAAGTGSNSSSSRPNAGKTFVDPHFQWDLQSAFLENGADVDGSQGLEQNWDDDEHGDTESVDSDDYGFVLRPLELQDQSFKQESRPLAAPPVMVLASTDGMVLMSLFTIDDAVEHALVVQNKPALALKRALLHRRQLRRYKVADLVNSYLEAVLQLSAEYDFGATLSLRRMKLAIQAMPVLLGGQTSLWTEWTSKLEKLPGALFILRSYLPVRDPLLPASLFERVLKGMLGEVERLRKQNKVREEGREEHITPLVMLDHEAASHFLESLLAWGATRTLKEYIKLYQYSRRKGDKSVTNELKSLEMLLRRRYLQTSAGYLQFPISTSQDYRAGNAPQYNAHQDDSKDALFRIENVLDWVSVQTKTATSDVVSTLTPTDHVCLEALARLQMMQGHYDLALQAYLGIGAIHSPLSMADLESWAIETVQQGSATPTKPSVLVNGTNHEFVLGLVENHHLHRLVLDQQFLKGAPGSNDGELGSPLFALFRLIGLPRVGDFLVEHCVTSDSRGNGSRQGFYRSESDKDTQRPETLPIELVSEQLESNPPLLHWYLHLVFTRRPELYVKFPRNYIPPKTVTELHRRHFQLHLDFAGDAKDSAVALAGTETYKMESKLTPLLAFLKAALPLGGLSPIDARRQLETIRSEDVLDSEDDDQSAVVSHSFSLELAYILEHYSDHNETEAMAILEMYLKGCNSIMLGVAYAQRQQEFSSTLWDELINHCLAPGPPTADESTNDGMLFGELLEAAAISGANLARLVARIPPGMVVEGLRPRLVAAVADYRLKLDIHQAAVAAAQEEKVSLLREVAHRSRRGARYQYPKLMSSNPAISHLRAKSKETDANDDQKVFTLPKGLRTMERRDRHSLAYSLPMR